jgi:hypothetical protein
LLRTIAIVACLAAAAACADETEPLETPDAAPIDAGSVDAAEGAQVGEACVMRQDCASADSPYGGLYPPPCFTAWPSGYCVDYCAVPADALAGPSLVRADCPSGSVCVPRSDVLDRPDIGACVRECTRDDDCRNNEPAEVYYCRRDFSPADPRPMLYDNGYCAPMHCRTRGCPTSFLCEC